MNPLLMSKIYSGKDNDVDSLIASLIRILSQVHTFFGYIYNDVRYTSGEVRMGQPLQ